MSNRIPTPQQVRLASVKLETAIGMAYGAFYTQDISTDAAEILCNGFLEQMSGAAEVLGLELVERHIRIPDSGNPGEGDTVLTRQADGLYREAAELGESCDLDKVFPNGVAASR